MHATVFDFESTNQLHHLQYFTVGACPGFLNKEDCHELFDNLIFKHNVAPCA
jgi:hypothetical protein